MERGRGWGVVLEKEISSMHKQWAATGMECYSHTQCSSISSNR